MKISTLFMLLTVAVGPASARPAPSLDFVPIGNPGNRDTIPSEVPHRPNLQIGGVDYEFAITRSPIDVEQWYEFVVAYTPYSSDPTSIGFSSWYIGPAAGGGWEYDPQHSQVAVGVYWRNAARYCNWLHNGKTNEAWAFENGVYDTSTFGFDDEGNFTDQTEPSPDAKFWLPRYDEWIKAVYYDPDRYGEGEGGYWQHPGGSDDILRPGMPPPLENGQTDADGVPLDVILPNGSYPNARTPYGLLDVSGGEEEWTTTRGTPRLIYALSTQRHIGGGYAIFDRLHSQTDGTSVLDFNAFRIATRIPSVPVSGVMLVFMLMQRRERR